MSMFGCNCRCNCTLAAIFVSVIAGVLGAFLQITGVITVAPVFLWTIFGIAVAFLALYLLTSFQCSCDNLRECECDTLNIALAGALGTVLFPLVLIAVGIVATSVTTAILVGLSIGFFSLLLTATACLVRTRFHCS